MTDETVVHINKALDEIGGIPTDGPHSNDVEHLLQEATYALRKAASILSPAEPAGS